MYKGVYTALVTPFNKDGSLDEECLRQLVRFALANDISGLVPCGTTGESPTLSDSEWERVVKIVIKEADGRVPVIVGTGTNSTSKTIEKTKKAKELSASGALVVNPYYNKPTQKGLYLHFREVANSVPDIDIVVYNIKGRTGVNVETQTLVKLVNECPNIVCVKEASGDIEQMKEVIARTPEDFSVLSGDDGMTFDLIRERGHGVISVLSNLLPKEICDMTKTALDGDFEKASKINSNLEELYDAEFIETNPIPIKFMMAQKGLCGEVYRLPMCEMESFNKEKVLKIMRRKGI